MNYGADGLMFRFSLYQIPYSISAWLLLNESTSYSVANSALQNHPQLRYGASNCTPACALDNSTPRG